MAFRYDNNRTKTTSARNGSPRTTRGAASNAMATMAPPPPPQYHTLSTPKTFDQVVTIPGTEETETSINFVSLTDLEIDVGRIQPGVGPLDVSGNTCYECTFMVDSESAILANVRKARLVFYLTQPANFAPAPVIIDSVGSITHHNASYARAATGRADAAGTAYGHDVARRQGGSTNNVISARIADAVEPNIVDPDDGRVYQCDIPLGINDTMVTEYHLWVEQETAPAAPARPSNPPLPAQRSVVQLTDTIRISSDLGGNRTQIDNTRLQTSPRARANTTSEVSNTNSSNRLTVLTQGRDPTAHLNNFYAQGPTGGRGPRGRPINYSLHGVGRNQVRKTSQKVIASSYKSVASSGRQNKTTQRIQTTYPTRAQEELYQNGYQETLRVSPEPRVPVIEYEFETTVLEFLHEFDIPFTTISPRTNTFWVRMELLDRDDSAVIAKTFPVNLREQIEPLLIPVEPPTIEITNMVENGCEIQLTQQDNLATDISLYRMMANPENIEEAQWVHVVDSIQNISDLNILYNDTTLVGNVKPKVIIYEARCTGPLGGMCSTTGTVVKMGVKKSIHVPDLGGTQGECTISPKQVEGGISIVVDDIPKGVSRVKLLKDHINTSQRSERWKTHSYVPLLSHIKTGRTWKDIAGHTGPIEFKDTRIADKGIYRYYAEFDWDSAKSSTLSVTDEYIQYVSPPPAPLQYYISNVTIGLDENEMPKVSFEFGATLTEEGIEEINVAMGETGASAIFTEELKKDRSIVSSLVMASIVRRDLKSGDYVQWPLKTSGFFVDSPTHNAAAGFKVPSLKPGRKYTYTMHVHLTDPETFFSEAMTKIPASTRQIIVNTDPNFTKVSAQKFGDNFALAQGDMLSESTIERQQTQSFRERVMSQRTGYNRVIDVKVPRVMPQLQNIVIKRGSRGGRMINKIGWEVGSGDINLLYKFELGVTVGRKGTFPLAEVSAITGRERRFTYQDELFSNEIVPVSYYVKAIYVDMTESKPLHTKEIHGGTTKPLSLVKKELSRQREYKPKFDITKPGPNITNAEIQEEKRRAANPLLKGTTPLDAISTNQKIEKEVQLRKLRTSPKVRDKMKKLNPKVGAKSNKGRKKRRGPTNLKKKGGKK